MPLAKSNAMEKREGNAKKKLLKKELLLFYPYIKTFSSRKIIVFIISSSKKKKVICLKTLSGSAFASAISSKLGNQSIS